MYIKRIKSDVWHWNILCQHYDVVEGVPYIERATKPKSGELCNECLAKDRKLAKFLKKRRQS